MNKYEERLYEIKFYDFVNKFFKNVDNPKRIYDFLELMSDMLGIDYLMLRSATKRCIMDEYHIRPMKDEVVVLYDFLDRGVRPTCRKLGINTGSYYYSIKKYEAGSVNINPRFTDKERTAIITMMKQLHKLLTVLD